MGDIWLMVGVFLPYILCEEAAQYYHEASYIKLKPESMSPTADFGFSITYQHGVAPNMVIGSPHSDRVGHVYKCPISGLLGAVPQCEKLPINVDNSVLDYKEGDPDQIFCLGATVVATEDYIFTCAPLWPGAIREKGGKTYYKKIASYGTCFAYNNDDKSINEYYGLFHQQRKKKSSTAPTSDKMYSAIGWSSIVDETNEVILLGKPGGITGDIIYMSSKSPTAAVKSMIYSNIKSDLKIADSYDYFKKEHNIGYALASGNFFNNSRTTIYFAFSLRDKLSFGKVSFLKYEGARLVLLKISNYKNVEYIHKETGSMFGAALSSCDINKDGLADLLVGAPASVDKNIEVGALFIYLGGNKDDEIDDSNYNPRLRIISGVKAGARFGTSIAASDLDGDAIPEIIVSAPYEDGSGALYILSGHELKQELIVPEISKIDVSELKSTQIVRESKFQTYGFTLQVIPDIDENGCAELAVGVPQNASVAVLRCVPTVNATVSTRLLNEEVKESDKDFTMEVCVDISYPEKPKKITTKFWAISKINEEIIDYSKFYVAVDIRKTRDCKNITVNLNEKDEQLVFSASLESDIESLMRKKEFEPTWVRLNPHYSKPHASRSVALNCKTSDCEVLWQTEILWAGSANVTELVIDSNSKKTMTIVIANEGSYTYDACLRLRIEGAGVFNPPCPKDGGDGNYLCRLPKLSNDTKPHNLDFTLYNMDKATNTDQHVIIEGDLYDHCNHPHAKLTPIRSDVKLSFSVKNVHIEGFSHSINVTDTSLLNLDRLTFPDTHQYLIVNNGSLTWQDILVLVTVPKSKVVQNYTISSNPLSLYYTRESDDSFQFNFTMKLVPNETVRVFITINVLKQKIVENLIDNKLEISSEIKVSLNPALNSILSERQITTIYFVKELTIKNNKVLIIVLAVIGAIVILAVIIFILFKVGFFKSKEKQQLELFKEQMKRGNAVASIILSASGVQAIEAKEDDNFDNMEDFNMEVVDDCPFEIIEPMTEADDIQLIDKEHVEEPVPSTSKENPHDTIQTKC